MNAILPGPASGSRQQVEMGNPPEITRAIPRATFIIPSVGMNDEAIEVREQQAVDGPEPNATATVLPPTAIRATRLQHQRRITHASPNTEPTDRSIPAV